MVWGARSLVPSLFESPNSIWESFSHYSLPKTMEFCFVISNTRAVVETVRIQINAILFKVADY